MNVSDGHLHVFKYRDIARQKYRDIVISQYFGKKCECEKGKSNSHELEGCLKQPIFNPLTIICYFRLLESLKEAYITFQ